MHWEQAKEEIKKDKNYKDHWYLLGVDLGTTNTVISYWDGSKHLPEPIDLSHGFGKVPMPSVVQYRKEGLTSEWVIGEEALATYPIFPDQTILSIKSKMGTKEKVDLYGQSYLPEEISAKILSHVMDHIRQMDPKAECIGLVVSVPYDFDDAAKKATMQACHLAGLQKELICLIEEPKAAALAYNFRQPLAKEETLMVFDFGGGTLDITLFKVVEKGAQKMTLKVLSEGGAANHGGDHVDQFVLAHFKSLMAEKGLAYDPLSPENKADLYMKAKEIKERLSGVQTIRVPFTFCMPPFMYPMEQKKLESISAGFIEKTKDLILDSLKNAYQAPLSPSDIDQVILEGGASTMPWVKRLLGEILGDSDKTYVSDKPALDISMGACYYAAMKLGVLDHPEMTTIRKNIDFEVSLAHDIGFEIEVNKKTSFYPLLHRGTPYPLAKRSQTFTLSGQDMTSFELKILERVKPEDPIDQCRQVGQVVFKNLPERPSGKTQLRVTLTAHDQVGMVSGAVYDLGYQAAYPGLGLIGSFTPKRQETITIINEKKE